MGGGLAMGEQTKDGKGERFSFGLVSRQHHPPLPASRVYTTSGDWIL